MEVHLKPDTEAAIRRLAADQSSNVDDYLQQLVETHIDHDLWFRQKVQEGINAADAGDLVDHEMVRHEIDSWFAG